LAVPDDVAKRRPGIVGKPDQHPPDRALALPQRVQNRLQLTDQGQS
jgi:hypothetical protein